jgi:hypothetical protein
MVLVLAAIASSAGGAEPILAPVPNSQADGSITVIDNRAIAMHEYFYIDFPRQLRALQRERELAEADLALAALRVESYRPFRSFGRYAATYTADLSWQVELIAAEYRLECLREKEADLWRQRRLIAEQFVLTVANTQLH